MAIFNINQTYKHSFTSSYIFQGLVSPHAMAVSPDGEEVYVGELYTKDPAHSVWKFIKAEQPKDEPIDEPEQQVEMPLPYITF